MDGREPDGGRRARLRAWLRSVKPTPREVLASAIGVVVLLWLLWQRCGIGGCPDVMTLNSYQPGGATILLDRAGAPFADLAPVHHAVVSLDSLPPYVPAAFLAVEDKRFYSHHGVDWRRALGAALADVRARGFAQGFSTITMQLARNVWHDRLPGEQRTLKRKVLEIRVAREIEHRFTKPQILSLYLNQINFGEGAFGIEAAARTYFGVRARNLTLSQAATLAGVPKSPVLFDPRRQPRRARTRRNLILGLMAAQGKISEVEGKRARRLALNVTDEPPRPRRGQSPFAGYFVDEVRRVLEDHLGDDIYTAPLRVVTTLDRTAQSAAEEELSRQLRSIEDGQYGRLLGERYPAGRRDSILPGNYLQGTAIVMRADSGDVLALVGGRDYTGSPFDRATRALRQPGSAFKPFVYAAALAEGYAPSQHIADTPLRMQLAGGEVWEPHNFSGEFQGDVTLREALVESINVPTIRLAAAVGIPAVVRLARRAGVTSPLPELPSVAIGAAAVTPIELTAAYTAFAHGGEAVQPRFVLRVEDEDGNIVWRSGVERRRVVGAGVAYLVTDMLGDAVDEGTGTAVRDVGFRGPVAGKTGTTNDAADTWFVGYTPKVVGSVWIGFDQPVPIVHDATGGKLAAPVWGRIMRRALRGRSRTDWTEPTQVISANVDPSTGLLLQTGCRPARGQAERELFLKDMKPASACPRGEPRSGRNPLAWALTWIENAFGEARDWIARHLGREAPAPPRHQNDRFLGSPRLPPQGELPPPEVTIPDLHERPVMPPLPDTIVPQVPESIPTPETMPVPPPPPDTLPVDTVRASP